MVLFNYQRREITGKLVYYGPGLCGKTTNLQYIHDAVDPSDRGKMVSLSTDADRTLFFDFMPVDAGYIKGMKIKFQLYTVPGQVHYNETRKMVLRGADAVVFVADSQKSLLDSNVYSYENMLENLEENGLDPQTIPLVIQYNKRDLAEIMAVDELEKNLNQRKVTCFEAVAINGTGVMETFQEIGRLLLIDIGNKYKVEVTAEKDRSQSESLKKKLKSKESDPLKDNEIADEAAETSHDAAEESDIYGGVHYGTMANEFDLDYNDEGQLDLTRHVPPETEIVFHPREQNVDEQGQNQTAINNKAEDRSENLSVKDLENQMDLKIIMQRLKKIMEENYNIIEKQTSITREIDTIREEIRKHLKQ